MNGGAGVESETTKHKPTESAGEGPDQARSQRLTRAFRAYDVRALVPDDLDSELAHDVARAFADVLPEGTVAVGRDMRADSDQLAEAFIEGLIKQGREVLDIGMVTTDMSYWAVGQYDLAGAAMITASHNPGRYDGIKFTQAGAVQMSAESGLEGIRDAAIAETYKEVAEEGRKLEKNILSDWVEHTLRYAGGELKPLKVGIDAGNGMASIVVPKLQELTPLEISGLYMELDGTFPNHSANPMAPGATDDLQQLVTRHELDCGIAFDGDGDRCFFIDEKGQMVTSTELGALLASTFLEENPHSTIVANVTIGDALREVTEGMGGTIVRSRVGHSIVSGVMRDENAIFGAESAGHFYYRDNFYCDSALITAIMVLGILSQTDKTLSELVKPYRKQAHIDEAILDVPDWPKLLKGLKEQYTLKSLDELDGLTIRGEDWWANIRPSNTEPVVKLNIEAKNKTLLGTQEKELRNFVKSFTA